MGKSSVRLVAGAMGAGVVVAVGAGFAVRAVRRRRKKRVLPKRVRKDVAETVGTYGDALLANDGIGSSLLRKRVDALDDKQLIALFALVQVGRFVKESGIDPLHPSKGQIAQAAERLASSKREAPAARSELIGRLWAQDSTPEAVDAMLSAALSVLTHHA